MGVARADALAVATLDHHCFADLIPKVCSRAAGHHANPRPSLTPERQRSLGFALASPLHLHPRRHNALVPVPRWALIHVDGRAFVAAVTSPPKPGSWLGRSRATRELWGLQRFRLGLPAPRSSIRIRISLGRRKCCAKTWKSGGRDISVCFFRAAKKKNEIRVLNRCNRTPDSVVEGRRDNMKEDWGGARAL